MRNLFINNKIVVNFFQRRPREGFNFSIEYIFEDLRKRLGDRILSNVYTSRCYNDGYCSKIINILEAAFRKKKGINHITGEVHYLNFFLDKRNVLLTIHDCGVMHRKKGLSGKIAKWLYFVMPVKRSTYVTAVSEITKQEIINYTGCNPDKIRVIPVAIDPKYQPTPKTFNKKKPVILHIGTGTNKNLLRLIEAVKGIDCHLMIVGKLNEEYLQKLRINEVEFSNEYNVPGDRLLEKYLECDIVAFVSTFEGFGMPIVEANAVERVVVTSNISSMPEVAADAACLVDPYSVASIRSGILRVINDDGFREDLINKGKANKLRFDALKIAEMYYDLYMEMS